MHTNVFASKRFLFTNNGAVGTCCACPRPPNKTVGTCCARPPRTRILSLNYEMKKITILLPLMTRSDSSFAQRQPLTTTLAKNDRGNLPAVVEATGTFQPVRPSGIQQNSSWRERGTDVRSTSLRAVRPSGIQQNS